MKIKPSYAGRSQPTKQSSSPRDLPTLRAHQDQREPNDIFNDNDNEIISGPPSTDNEGNAMWVEGHEGDRT